MVRHPVSVSASVGIEQNKSFPPNLSSVVLFVRVCFISVWFSCPSDWINQLGTSPRPEFQPKRWIGNPRVLHRFHLFTLKQICPAEYIKAIDMMKKTIFLSSFIFFQQLLVWMLYIHILWTTAKKRRFNNQIASIWPQLIYTYAPI